MFVARKPKMGAATFAGIGMIFVGIFAMLLGLLGVSVAGATQPNPEHTITLCHRTDSYSNPYITESVDVASPLFEGHDGHDGPVFYAAIPKGTKWGDIIPAFDFGPGEQYAGKNLTNEGEAILANNCIAPDAVTTTTTTQPDEPTTTSTSTTTSIPTNETSTTSEATTTSTSTGPVVTGEGSTVRPIGGQGTPGDPGVTTAEPGSGSLPFTGSPVSMLLGIGGALIASGIGLVVRRRNWAR